MGQVYCVVQNKGGNGKTTLVTNLAAAISDHARSKKICVLDMDGQGNAAMAFGIKINDDDPTIYDVIVGTKTVEEVMHPVTKNLTLIPANANMDFLEFDLLTDPEKAEEPFSHLRPIVDQLRDQFDLIFIDTPPSIGLAVGNVLNASDSVLIPFSPESFAVRGLFRVKRVISEMQELNPSLTIGGIIGMMVENRTVLHSEMMQEARRWCAKNDIQMYDTFIPKSIRFASAVTYESKPAVWVDKSNPIVSSYFELMEEFFSKEAAE